MVLGRSCAAPWRWATLIWPTPNSVMISAGFCTAPPKPSLSLSAIGHRLVARPANLDRLQGRSRSPAPRKRRDRRWKACSLARAPTATRLALVDLDRRGVPGGIAGRVQFALIPDQWYSQPCRDACGCGFRCPDHSPRKNGRHARADSRRGRGEEVFRSRHGRGRHSVVSASRLIAAPVRFAALAAVAVVSTPIAKCLAGCGRGAGGAQPSARFPPACHRAGRT